MSSFNWPPQPSGSSSSGANTYLSNLSSPTSVNQSLIPASPGTYNLGSSSLPYGTLYTDSIQLVTSGGTITLNPPATVTPYTLTFPTAQGAANTFLENDGSGNLSWQPSGANVYLSNLVSPTAINQTLTPGAASTYDLGSSALPFGNLYLNYFTFGPQSTFVGTLDVVMGLNSTDPSGYAVIQTNPNNDTTINGGNSSTLGILTGNSAGTSGDIIISTGAGTAGNGLINLGVGNTTTIMGIGALYSGGASVFITSASAIYPTLAIEFLSGQSANVLEITNGFSAPFVYVNSSGQIGCYSLLFNGTSSGSVTISGPATITPYSVTLPAAQGAASTVLQNDGSGNLSWVNAGSLGTMAINRNISSVSSATSAGSAAYTDYVYFVTGATTITLPTAVGNKNMYTVKNTGTSTVMIATIDSQTIDGSSAVTMPTQNQSLDILSDGTNWHIV